MDGTFGSFCYEEELKKGILTLLSGMVVTLTHVVLNVESDKVDSVLSPLLFNVYLNVLVKSLEISSLRCHLHGEYIGCLVYADDIVLLSASVVNLQRMLDACHI